MICTKVHPHGDRNDNYYRIDKYMANYERCFLGCEYTVAEIDECSLNIRGRTNHESF